MPNTPIMEAEQLSKEDLVQLVDRIQTILWYEVDSRDFWNPQKHWDDYTLPDIAEAMSDYGLNPEKREIA